MGDWFCREGATIEEAGISRRMQDACDDHCKRKGTVNSRNIGRRRGSAFRDAENLRDRETGSRSITRDKSRDLKSMDRVLPSNSYNDRKQHT